MSASVESAIKDRYQPDPHLVDEFVQHGGGLREHWLHTGSAIAGLGLEELTRRQSDVRRLLDADGVTYRLLDEGRNEPWRLDAVPLLVSSTEWATIESAVTQRAVLLDLILRDLYGERKLLSRGVLPAELVLRSPGFLPNHDGIALHDGSQLFTYAVDLGRDDSGQFRVAADFAQAPAGAGYALENRVVMSRVFPSLYRDAQVHRVAPFFRALRAGLERLAEHRSDYPRIVVLTPGPYSETAFEHAYLASYLGYSLVEGNDLVVRNGEVFLRALGGLEGVDVILRRVDAAYSDPLELRPDSRLGVPGLLEACRRGTVSVVNTLGSGVIEAPALAAYLPAAAEALLGQDLQIPGLSTWWCGEPEGLARVLDHFDDLLIKPIAATPAGPGSLLPRSMSADEREALRARIIADPGGWSGSELLALSTSPTLTPNGLAPRRTLLRTYAVAAEGSFRVMSGGLTRVAPDEGSALITNQRGAIAKDTWVLSTEPEQPSLLWMRDGPMTTGDSGGGLSERGAENLFWMGRYLERSESMVRLLRVVHDRRSDQTLADEADRRVVEVLLAGLERTISGAPSQPLDRDRNAVADELFSLAGDVGRPGSLAFSVDRLLTAAGAVRDQLSTDTWQVTSSLEQALLELSVAPPGRQDVVQDKMGSVMQALLALHGLVGESMVRDVGWYFLDAGRRIERFQFLAGLLQASLADRRDAAIDSLVLESVLVSAESIVTYRRRYRSRAQVQTVLDLLMNDPGNPRSLLFQVNRLDEALVALPQNRARTGASSTPDPGRFTLELSTRLRLADTGELATVSAEGTRPSLTEFMSEALNLIVATADSVAEANFGTQPLPRSITAVVKPDPIPGADDPAQPETSTDRGTQVQTQSQTQSQVSQTQSQSQDSQSQLQSQFQSQSQSQFPSQSQSGGE